jgi:cytidylate kinase
MQHGFCRAPGLVADGRDMGTVVFPNAELKIFLTAKTETRAQRRYQQLLAKNQVSLDFSNTYDSILQDLLERDARDKNRASAPLTLADDAILLETDNLSISAAVDNVLYNFQQKISK